MYSQATSSALFNPTTTTTSSNSPISSPKSLFTPSKRAFKLKARNEGAQTRNDLADYAEDLRQIKIDDQERHKLREFVKHAENLANVRPFLPQAYINLRMELVPERIRLLCLRVLLDREKKKLLSDEEINHFADAMEASDHAKLEELDGRSAKTISFIGLTSVLHNSPKAIGHILQPVTFFRAHFPDWDFQTDLRMSIDTILEFLSLKNAFMRNRINMAWYDPDSTGCLTREQLCDYYCKEVMPLVDVLKDLEETFQICYLNTVESMFFFFLDPKHTGRIRITDALVSGFLENAFSLQTNSEDYENWFSPEKTHEMNAMFQMFDSKHKNYLDKHDFKQLQDGSFTQTFVERLFETHVAKGGEAMSYEEFIIFQIAYNHLAHPASIAYFFKVLDIDGNGVLTRFEFRYFYTELCRSYNEWMAIDGAMPEFDDFTDQFFDMVKPVEDGRISLQELLSCKQGHDFILCLINYQEFYRYETRDSEGNANIEQDSAIPILGEFDGEDDIEEEDPPLMATAESKVGSVNAHEKDTNLEDYNNNLSI